MADRRDRQVELSKEGDPAPWSSRAITVSLSRPMIPVRSLPSTSRSRSPLTWGSRSYAEPPGTGGISPQESSYSRSSTCTPTVIRTRPTLPGVAPHLGNPARPLHFDPEPSLIRDDPTARSFPIDVLLHVPDLLPPGAVVLATSHTGCTRVRFGLMHSHCARAARDLGTLSTSPLNSDGCTNGYSRDSVARICLPVGVRRRDDVVERACSSTTFRASISGQAAEGESVGGRRMGGC
jgi:hypothetical protein